MTIAASLALVLFALALASLLGEGYAATRTLFALEAHDDAQRVKAATNAARLDALHAARCPAIKIRRVTLAMRASCQLANAADTLDATRFELAYRLRSLRSDLTIGARAVATSVACRAALSL